MFCDGDVPSQWIGGSVDVFPLIFQLSNCSISLGLPLCVSCLCRLVDHA